MQATEPVIPVIAYESPPAGRTRMKLALASLGFVIITCPILTLGLLRIVSRAGWLDDHFVCCEFPEVAAMIWVGLPLLGATGGAIALGRTRFQRGRGMASLLALAALLLGVTFAVLGVGLCAAVKA